MSEGWGKGWGVYLNSNASFADIRKHLRRFLMVQDEEKRSLYFRFYDPRVLRVFLPTCTIEESTEFFGPISRFVVEGDDPAHPLQFKSAVPVMEPTRLDRTGIKG